MKEQKKRDKGTIGLDLGIGGAGFACWVATMKLSKKEGSKRQMAL